MSKELSDKTKIALKALKESGGVATLEDLRELTKGSEDYELTFGSANLRSLVKRGYVKAEPVEITYEATKTVNQYTLVDENPEDEDKDSE